MPRSKLILGMLVVLNVILLAAVLAQVVPGQTAFAQPANISSQYIAVTSEITSGTDALYIIDIPDRRLYFMMPSKGANPQLRGVASRSLTDDFRGQPQP